MVDWILRFILAFGLGCFVFIFFPPLGALIILASPLLAFGQGKNHQKN